MTLCRSQTLLSLLAMNVTVAALSAVAAADESQRNSSREFTLQVQFFDLSEVNFRKIGIAEALKKDARRSASNEFSAAITDVEAFFIAQLAQKSERKNVKAASKVTHRTGEAIVISRQKPKGGKFQFTILADVADDGKFFELDVDTNKDPSGRLPAPTKLRVKKGGTVLLVSRAARDQPRTVVLITPRLVKHN